MKHLKKFEAKQEIKKKDLSEMIDEVLDRLSKRGELSESEKEFMDEASKETIKTVTIPQTTGNFWADMANPHNIGIMWQGKDGVWKQLMSIEDEEDEKLEEIEDSDERYERKRKLNAKRDLDKNPGLREDLTEYLELLRHAQKKAGEIQKKYKKPYGDDSHNFNQSINVATNGKIESLINIYGEYDYDEDNDIDISKIL